jgi:hypothetical protein
MKVIQNRRCSFCDKDKTCYVFDDFDSMISSCFDCFDYMEHNISFTDEFEEVCTLCDQRKMVKEIDFKDSFLYPYFKICNVCNIKLKQLVETTDEKDFKQ